MKLHIYLQQDIVSGLFEQVLIDNKEPEDMLATLRAAARDGKIDHRTDETDIFYVGTFDNRNGDFELIERRRFVCHMKEFADLADVYAAKVSKKEFKDVGRVDQPTES